MRDLAAPAPRLALTTSPLSAPYGQSRADHLLEGGCVASEVLHSLEAGWAGKTMLLPWRCQRMRGLISYRRSRSLSRVYECRCEEITVACCAN